MNEELIKAKKKIGLEFLNKIYEYKERNNISYKEMSKIVGINNYYFGNLRYKIKVKGIIPTEKVLKKFKKIGII